MKNIHKILVFILFLLILPFLEDRETHAEESCSPTVPCPTENQDSSNDQNFNDYRPSDSNKVCIFHFWGAGCKACASVDEFIHQVADAEKDKVELKSLEIYYNEENRALFDDFNYRYGVDKPGVPAIFIGDTYLGGPEAIIQNLESKINYYYEHKTTCPLDVNKIAGITEEPKKLTLTLPAILIGAAADSINPCAFAVLTFLLVYLLAFKKRKQVFIVGMIYIIVVFIVYFISGLGILQLSKYLIATKWVIKLISLITIGAGLINIKDFFFYGKGISLHIPDSKKPLIEKYVRQASIPGAIILGFLVSAFELPCTGGVYLAILGILAQDTNKLQSILYLLIYNFIFVLPLFIILFVVSRGLDPEKLDTWRLDKRKWLRLIMGLIMLVIGFGLFLGFF